MNEEQTVEAAEDIETAEDLESVEDFDTTEDFEATELSWELSDIERRLGFRAARFTQVNSVLTCLLAIVITVLVYGVLVSSPSVLSPIFLDRGPTQYCVVFLSAWSISILMIKWQKLRLQRQALQISIVPQENTFVLTPATAHIVSENAYASADHPDRFMLLNRILVAISNLKNIGRIGDVDEILRSQAEREESMMESSYALLRGFIWAVPVLGFIGTVIGLSGAIGNFGVVLDEAADFQAVTNGLRNITADLATAFETTLVALVAALGLQMIVTFVKKSEEDFLDECSEYCLRHIVNRLRITEQILETKN